MTHSDSIKPATEHTPGPWDYRPDEDGKPITNGTVAIAYMDAYQPEEDDGGLWEKENEANARMIAAAPDLLEALQAASDWIDAQLFEPRLEIQAKVRAAIDKAKGGCL